LNEDRVNRGKKRNSSIGAANVINHNRGKVETQKGEPEKNTQVKVVG